MLFWWLAMMSIFSCACWPSVYCLCKIVYLSLLSTFKFFFFSILSCISCSYILLLLFISLANTFFHLMCCLWILLMVLFAVQNPLSLIWSHMSIFAFVSCSLVVSQIKYCYYLFKSFGSMFNSSSFTIYLTLRPLNHFVFLFLFFCTCS